MDPTHEADLKNAFASVESNGIKAFPVVTNDPDLPWSFSAFPLLVIAMPTRLALVRLPFLRPFTCSASA
jgi:hypothetical protein